ncbi:MAG TPA: hypothetical protein DEB58_01570 [Alphaproteobacteria bacterium]|jgi:hypothetical protein|nr:hypothetical protein [Alphaproteobacteria bacterium]
MTQTRSAGRYFGVKWPNEQPSAITAKTLSQFLNPANFFENRPSPLTATINILARSCAFALFQLRDMLASFIWVMLAHHLANHFFLAEHFFGPITFLG